MTTKPGKLTIPTVLKRFAAYYEKNPAWGSLHVVLDDDNVKDPSVEWCVGWAQERGDREGEALARILLKLSPGQRLRLPGKVDAYLGAR